jgi:hypothetical protein
MAGKPDRDWEHWPARRTHDERRRFGLRALFSPTDQPQVVEELIGERSRELEQRTEELHATIADLEHREEQSLRLRAAVEEMLRRGSAELDERHAELTALAAGLPRKSSDSARPATRRAPPRARRGRFCAANGARRRSQSEAAVEQVPAGRRRRPRGSHAQDRRLVARETELDARAAGRRARDDTAVAGGGADSARAAVTAAQATVSRRDRS